MLKDSYNILLGDKNVLDKIVDMFYNVHSSTLKKKKSCNISNLFIYIFTCG